MLLVHDDCSVSVCKIISCPTKKNIGGQSSMRLCQTNILVNVASLFVKALLAPNLFFFLFYSNNFTLQLMYRLKFSKQPSFFNIRINVCWKKMREEQKSKNVNVTCKTDPVVFHIGLAGLGSCSHVCFRQLSELYQWTFICSLVPSALHSFSP